MIFCTYIITQSTVFNKNNIGNTYDNMILRFSDFFSPSRISNVLFVSEKTNKCNLFDHIKSIKIIVLQLKL